MRFAVVAWVVALAACSTNASAVSGRARFIVNGAPAGADSAVVQLLLHTTEGGVSYCSGSLVSSDRILTAAHCVADEVWIDCRYQRLDRIDVYFGADSREADLHAVIAASEWFGNPDAPARDRLPEIPAPPLDDAGAEPFAELGPSGCDFGTIRLEPYVGGQDTGIVYLSEPAPSDITPLEMQFSLPASNEEIAQLPARIVGFGADGVVTNEDGSQVLRGLRVKREGPTRLRGISEVSRVDDVFGLYADTLEAEPAEEEYAAGCKGDSGGPLFVQSDGDSAWRIAAVTSWGEPDCTGVTRYATLAASRGFIAEHLRAAAF